MVDRLLLIGVFAAAWFGFLLLALSQARHWRQVFTTAPPVTDRVVALRLAGTGLLAVSLVLALLRDGSGFGPLLWITAISLAAFVVAFALAWWPRWLALLMRRLHSVPHSPENG